MDNPRDDTPTEQYRKRGAYTIAAVRADVETNGMEANFAVVHLELKTKDRQLEDLLDTLEEHEAVIAFRDRGVDKLARSFELRLLDLVNKNRDDPRYRRYMPDGLRAVTEADAREVEPKLVRDIIKTLDEDKDKPDIKPLYGEFRDAMFDAVQAVETADAACTQVEDEIAFLKDKTLVELKLRWVEERKKLHVELTKKFLHDPKRVESYFGKFAKPRKKKSP
jgi:hypothetical protein